MKAPSAVREVEDYLARVPEPARTTLNRIRAQIRSMIPAEATEYISYGMPAFFCNGPLIGYAARPGHCGLYPMNPAIIVQLRADLKGFETSKGAIRFPVDKPLPAAVLKKIVRARIGENAKKSSPR